MSATKRQAYRVQNNHVGQPRLFVYDCYLTPKRVAVYDAGQTTGASYYDPSDWPAQGAAWTEREAWENYLQAARQDWQQLRESLTDVQRQIAEAERTLGVLQIARVVGGAS